MTIPDWQKVKDLFADAIDLPVDQRLHLLTEKCAGDTQLFDEVNSLLSSASEPESLIEVNAIDIAAKIGGEEVNYVERHFGAYRIIREIGSGGMGTVFLAERDDGEFAMQVALKIVRQSVADRKIIERFKRERQVLANLNHPNIAALYDGGVNEKGEPYLAMEYVDGDTLLEYADAQKLMIRERLKLFLKVCSAVAYAHKNLVVHRDIKPSNILVTVGGEPKLLDFGLAKAFDADGSKTQTTLRAFTPAYASPEQIRGGPITTASDIYSLGAVFFELLTGIKPLDLENKSYDKVVQTINDTKPAKPSLVNPADRRDFPRRTLRGDLDNIALTALRKEPERRFASVEDLSKDIRDHLAGRPISARPNTYVYLTDKFVRRNKISVAAASLVLTAVVSGSAISLWQARVARRESAKSEVVNKFLQQMLLTAVPESNGGGKKGSQASMVDILNEASRRLDSNDSQIDPEIRVEIRQVLGEGYAAQGKNDEAERSLQTALSEQIGLYGGGNVKTLKTELRLASIYLLKADYERSLAIFERRYPDVKDAFRQGSIEPDFLVTSQNDYAVVSRALGNSGLAETLLRESVQVSEKFALGNLNRHSRTLLTLILLDQGKFDETKLSQEAVVTQLRTLSDAEVELAPALTLLGSIQIEIGEFREAEANLLEAETIYRKLYGPDVTTIYDNIRLQAQAAYSSGDYQGAERKINTVLENYRKTASPKYISFATALTIQGLTLNKLRKPYDAENVLREALKLRSENLPDSHFMTALTKGALGEVLLESKKLDEAEPLIRQSYTSLSASQKSDNGRIALAKSRLDSLESALVRNRSK